jgi:diphthine-ammonia ligase
LPHFSPYKGKLRGILERENVEKVFVSWSGGKDCCLALNRAKKSGMDVGCLVNMTTQDGKRSCSHGINADVIKKQAEALGVDIVQKRTTEDNYETVFTEKLKDLKRKGITGGVFGDIDFEPHREWIAKVCANAGIKATLPLWQEDQQKLMEEFIGAGFKSIIVAVRSDLLGEEALGRTIDHRFLAYISGLNKGITPCGEAGEFHSLVIDGPLFKKQLAIVESEKVTRGDHHFLEIKKTEFIAKLVT